MTVLYLLFFSFVVENPRITPDTLQEEKNYSVTDSAKNIKITGEKSFSASGEQSSADIFQSTNILINGKTLNGWQVEGVLYDERMKPAYDIYTIGLNDVNTAYLILHRKRDSFTFGRFSFYNRSIDGVSVKYVKGPIMLKAGGGKTRGTSGVFDTTITPPYNVPVKITLKNTDFFTIVESSERVFVNGQPMSKDEYSIDYSRCIITLNIYENEPQINLKVEFEYHTPFENPCIYAAEGHYNSTFFKTSIKYLNENSFKKYVYDSTGGVYLPEGGGDYEKQDSFFVYVGNGKGHYRVFFRLDTLNGTYVYDSRGFYVFAGRGKGNYSPVIFDRLPSLRNIKDISVKLGNRVYAKLDLLTSLDKTTKNSGYGGSISAGIRTRNLNFEMGLWKKEGNPEYIMGKFDSIRYKYVNHIENEQFARFYLKGEKWDGEFSVVHDTMPAWLFKFDVLSLSFYSRGNRKPEDITLKYGFRNSTLYAFNTSQNMRGISARTEIIPQTTITGTVFRDSTRFTHYIVSIMHSRQTRHTRVNISLTKTDKLFFYFFSSSVIDKSISLSFEFTRSLDFLSLFMERYVKTGEGNFIYDSTSGMLPSQFGEYTRVITEERSNCTAYKYTYSLSGYIRKENWQGNSYLTVEHISDNSRAMLSFNITHAVLKGSMLSANYETRHYITTDNTSNGGYESNLRFQVFQSSKVTPFIFENTCKDVFSGMQKNTTGMGFILKMHNVRLNTEISKNSHSLVKETYYQIKTESGIKLAKTSLTLTLAYSNLRSSSILPDAKFAGVSITKNLKIGSLNNVLNAYLYIPSNRAIRWSISTTLKF